MKEQKQIPLASFCMVCYNEEKYIAEALDAAFAQDYPNMEIIISDDCSSDGTWDIIQKKAAEYKGLHKIILNRNEPNLGPRENFNKVFYELSHGEFLFVAAGDDVSRSDRVRVCVDLMMSHPDVMSMSVASRYVDEDGNEIPFGDWSKISRGEYSLYTLDDYIKYDFYIFSGDSRVLRRRVIDAFPPLKYTYAEDIFLFVRSFLLGNVIYLREPLVSYRQRSESIMAKSRARKKTKTDIQKFKDTTLRQLQEDLSIAVENKYVSIEEIEFVKYKIYQLSRWLCPKRKTIYWRIVHRLSKLSSVFFEKVLRNLE